MSMTVKMSSRFSVRKWLPILSKKTMIKVLKIADLCTTKLVLKMLVDADSCDCKSPDNSFDKNDKLFSSNFPFLAAVISRSPSTVAKFEKIYL